MILYNETKIKFGYNVEDLSYGSKNRIVLKCDYCESEYDAQYKNRNKSYKKFPKDCCSKCKFKKREEVSIANYGVKNSAQREDVRKKISNNGWIKTEEFKEKRKESMLDKYGVEYPMQSKQLREKIINTKFKNNT